MSWIDKIKQDFIIRTADGKDYRPLWFDAQYVVNYNVSEFDFINRKGTLVVKRQPRGRIFDTDIRFQGEDCLEVSEAFKNSADVQGVWSVAHPLYGTVNVQVAALRFDNSKNNVVKINAVLLETTGEPNGEALNYPEEIETGGQVFIDGADVAYVEDVPVMPVSDIQRLRQTVDATYTATATKIASVQANLDIYRQAYNNFNTALNVAVFQVADVIESASALMAAPYAFANTLQERLDMFKVQLGIIAADLGILVVSGTPTRKRLYEHNAAVTISAMCRATVTNITTDYDYSVTVLGYVSQIVAVYNTYLTNLTALQTDNNGELDSYIPEAQTIIALRNLVFETLTNLYAVATQALQQRTYLIPYDTNLIDVAWVLYGLQQDDSTLFRLITTNNLVLADHLLLQKGREIIYYV